MYGVRLQIPDSPLLRRCFHSIVAMHQAAHNCDYYITKYQGKPMEQLQGLLVQIADLKRISALNSLRRDPLRNVLAGRRYA